MRLDKWLVDRGIFPSRQRAQLAIKERLVRVNGQVASKASLEIHPADDVQVLADPLRYVSRGGLKLEKAIRSFGLDFTGLRVLDAGASTGGFTDCALQHGAAQVFAIDVGTAQLHESLRFDPRVVCLENTDVRSLRLEQLGRQPVDAIVCDLSFISLEGVLPFLVSLLRPGGWMIVLVKPQFELGKRLALKGGIVTDETLRQQAFQRVEASAYRCGLTCRGKVETDVAEGERKNIECFLWLEKEKA